MREVLVVDHNVGQCTRIHLGRVDLFGGMVAVAVQAQRRVYTTDSGVAGSDRRDAARRFLGSATIPEVERPQWVLSS